MLLATNEAEFAVAWEQFNFNEARPHVNIAEHTFIFLHTVENSCPKTIKSMILRDGGSRLVIDTSQRGMTCDDLAVPKSFVIMIEHEKMQYVHTIVFEGETFPVNVAN